MARLLIVGRGKPIGVQLVAGRIQIGFQSASRFALHNTDRYPAAMPSPAVRDRVLHDAGDLFYREGINATGVNRVAEQLGVSKRTLYELFGSKDALVAEALRLLDVPSREQFTAGAEALSEDPVVQLAGIFTVVERWTGTDGFRGCPFLNAAAELADPDHPVHPVVHEHKEQLRLWMERRAREGRLRRPKALSQQLMLLLDGQLSQAAVGPLGHGVAREAAAALIAQARR